MPSFFRKLAWLIRRRTNEDQLAAELQFHLEEEAAEHQAAGLSAPDARSAARRDLGNLALVQEDTRAAWTWAPVEQFLQDLRYGLRTMLRNPAFTALAALSLALGIGANTAIYSFMDALLMRRLPVADPASLVVPKWRFTVRKETSGSVLHNISGQIYDDPRTGPTSAVFPYPAFEQLRQSGVLSVLFAYRPAPKLNVVAQGQAEVSFGEFVSGGYFSGLGVVPAAGRLIIDADDSPGSPAVVVLSSAFAQRRFGDAASAVGQVIRIGNLPFTAIGVAPPGFFGVDPSKLPQLYLPLHADLALYPERDPGQVNRYLDDHYYWTQMMGRLRPGVPLAQAQAALASTFHTWVDGTAVLERERQDLPRLLLQEGATGLDNLRRTYSQPLYLLLGMVGLILAIACANIANLLLARATARRREMAVRLSIGAGRWRVIRQMLTESVLLAALGGTAGILFAFWGMRFLETLLAGGGEPFPLRPAINTGVLAAASLVTVLAGLLFGLAPALQSTRVDPMPVLKESRTAGLDTAGRRFGLGRALVVSQMAICLLLLVGAGLFVRTLSNLHSLDVGFDRANILLFKLNARQAGHHAPEILPFYENLAARLAAVPGLRGAAIANSPLIGDGAWGWAVVPAGKPRPEDAPTGHGSGAKSTDTRVLAVGPGFFSTMRIPLAAGRLFDERDRAGAPAAAIVNEAWAKVNFPGENPLGRRITSFGMDNKPHDMEIVGLARNARYDDLTGDFPAVVYLPLEQNLDAPMDEMTFFLRTAGNPSALAAAVREIVRDADPRLPVMSLISQTAQIEQEIGAEALFARLCTAFALLALAIACVGLYGTTSYAVARRTSEIGIRMALGANQRSVVWMVLREVLVLEALGFAIGLPAALTASRLAQSLLFGVKSDDPRTIAVALAILFTAALAAGYLPARRASKIDPMTAVRQE